MNDNNNNNNNKQQNYFFSFCLAQGPLPPLILGLDINERDEVSTFSVVSTVLQRFEACNKSLQKIESDLDTVAKTYCSLEECIAEFRERFDDFNLQASELCGQDTEYKQDIRDVGDAETKQYDEFDNDSDDQPRSGRQIMRVDCFYVIISRLSS